MHEEEDKSLISHINIKWQFKEDVYNSFRTLPMEQCLVRWNNMHQLNMSIY